MKGPILLHLMTHIACAAAARMAKVRDLLQRATVRAEEVALLRGMVRQLRWAIRAKRP